MTIALIFVAPWIAVAGAACVSVPIIIHLLSRRRRPPVLWAAMRFVLEAWQARRRRLRLQQLLLLVVRCLIPIILGLALAQPLLSEGGLLGQAGQTVHLVIDNSLTADAPDASGATALSRHQEAALAVIESLGSGDEVGLTLLSNSSRDQSLPPQREHDRVAAAVKRLEVTKGQADVGEALDEVASRIMGDESRSHQVVLLSDFREGSGRVDDPLPPNLFNSDRVQLEYAMPADSAIEQVRIVDIQPLRRVVLRDGGVDDLASQSLVQLERDGERLPETVTTLTATSTAGRQSTRDVNWLQGQREAVVDFNLPVDDQDDGVSRIRVESGTMTAAQQRHVLVEVQDVLRVVILDREHLGRDQLPLELDAARWIERALRPIDELPIEVRRIDPIAMVPSDLVDADAVFLLRPDLLQSDGWESIGTFREAGGLVMVSPPGERQVQGWTEAMVQAMDIDWTFAAERTELDPAEGLVVADTDESVLRVIGAELPTLLEPVDVRQLVEVEPGMNGIVSVRTAEGRPLLVTESVPGRGTLAFLSTAPRLDWTNLPAKPLMVPLIQETLRGGLHLSRGKQQAVVGDLDWNQDMASRRGEIRHPDGTSILLDPTNNDIVIDRPGVWSMMDDNGTHRSWIVANVDPAAGDLDRQSSEAVGQWLEETGTWNEISTATATTGPGRSLVWLLLGVAAALLVIESLLARWFSPRGPMATPVLAGAVT